MSKSKILREDVSYEGETFQIVKRAIEFRGKTIELEIAKRSPGVRLIIVKNDKILLIREYRFELEDYDYRLPGGKVFDRLSDYKEALKNDVDIINAAMEAAKKECIEETGIIAKKINYFGMANSGQTVIWDLFYFIVEDFEETGKQDLGIGEEIYIEWKSFEEIQQLCIENKIKEYRTVGELLRFILLEKNKKV